MQGHAITHLHVSTNATPHTLVNTQEVCGDVSPGEAFIKSCVYLLFDCIERKQRKCTSGTISNETP